MKAESTIKRMIRRMRRLCDDYENIDDRTRGEVYEAYHALRWVVEDTSWTPMSLANASIEARTKKPPSMRGARCQ